MPACVVVPARDAAATLPALLDALARQTLAPGAVVVVDDGSEDGTGTLARAHPVVSAVVRTPGVGPGAARNAGVLRTGEDVIAFTDADCVPSSGWLAAAVAALEAGADVVQGAVVPDDGPAGPWDHTVRVGQPTGLYETANLVVRRAWFDRVGGFEAWLQPRRSIELGEDVWLGWRLRRAGARMAFAPDAVVAHANRPRPPTAYVAERGRVRFFPVIVARIPELRVELCFARVFLTRRTAAFDLAVAALLARRRWAPVATVPYAVVVARGARRWGWRRAPLIALVEVAADAVGAVALVAGSVRARRPLL